LLLTEKENSSFVINKLVELGADKDFITEKDVTDRQRLDLLKGILYLRERYPESFGNPK
jgi:hypothetical protein